MESDANHQDKVNIKQEIPDSQEGFDSHQNIPTSTSQIVIAETFLSGHEIFQPEKNVSAKEKFTCSFCHYIGVSRSALIIHERIHTGERPYSCSYCQKSFIAKFQLVRHERIHTGEKPYSCKKCDRSFTESGHCKVHERTCQVDSTKPKKYPCKLCTKSFARKSHLQNHQKSKHDKLRPYSCDNCGKSFTDNYYCKSHEKKCIEESTRNNPAKEATYNLANEIEREVTSVEESSHDQRNEEYIDSENIQVTQELHY